jgi:hypothetical protein
MSKVGMTTGINEIAETRWIFLCAVEAVVPVEIFRDLEECTGRADIEVWAEGINLRYSWVIENAERALRRLKELPLRGDAAYVASGVKAHWNPGGPGEESWPSWEPPRLTLRWDPRLPGLDEWAPRLKEPKEEFPGVFEAYAYGGKTKARQGLFRVLDEYLKRVEETASDAGMTRPKNVEYLNRTKGDHCLWLAYVVCIGLSWNGVGEAWAKFRGKKKPARSTVKDAVETTAAQLSIRIPDKVFVYGRNPKRTCTD